MDRRAPAETEQALPAPAVDAATPQGVMAGGPPQSLAQLLRRGAPDSVETVLELQRRVGNHTTTDWLLRSLREDPGAQGRTPASAARSIQRTPAAEAVEKAVSKPDPVAGVGDFPEAFRILNGCAMYDLLATLHRLQRSGTFETLKANLNQATGVYVERIVVAFRAVEQRGQGVTAQAFAEANNDVLAALPVDQQMDIARFLDPEWVPALDPGELATAPDAQLGLEYDRGLKGDANRLQQAEDEIERRSDDGRGVGVAPQLGAPGSAGTPGTTAVTPEVALKLLENMSKGEPAFKPEMGKGGCSWFVTEGSPHVGIDPAKSVNIQVEVAGLDKGVTFTETELKELLAKEAEATKGEAEAAFRERFNAKGPLNSRLRKSLERFAKKFAESRMWDRVGEIVARSPGKVGKVVLKGSEFSRSGDGAFAVVADPAKITVKGGPTALVEVVEGAGLKAEPAVLEAAEQAASKLKWAGRVRTAFRWGGRILIVVAIAADVYKIYYAEDRWKAVYESVGGWAGATAGAAAFSAIWTPADVAGPWAWVGHGAGMLIAGGIGYWIGSGITRNVYELVVTE